MTETVRLDSVCDIVMGQAPSGLDYNERREGWPLIAGPGDFGDRTPAPKKFTSSAPKLSRPGDIVLGIRASIGAKVWSDGEYCLGRGVAALRSRPSLDPTFLWYWLTAIESLLRSKGRGATFLQVSRADIAELPIRLPPLPEQRRIAAILDACQDLVLSREASIRATDALSDATFAQRFGSATAGGPRPVGTVSDLVSGFSSGKSIVGDGQVDSGFRVLKISAVTSGRFKPEETKPLPDGYVPPSSHLVHKGDLLISRANTSALVGATALVLEDITNVALPDKLWRFNWRREAGDPSVYVWAAFSRPEFRQSLSDISSGSGGSMKNITQDAVLRLPMVSPSIEERGAFASEIAAILRLRDQQLRHLVGLQELFASLQHRAFRGEL